MTDPRGHDTVEWTEYGGGSVRLQKKTVPGVGSVSLTRVVDGFTTAVTGFDGATARRQRTYMETGITYADTDVRGNVFTAVCDIAGRIISGTDAAATRPPTLMPSPLICLPALPMPLVKQPVPFMISGAARKPNGGRPYSPPYMLMTPPAI